MAISLESAFGIHAAAVQFRARRTGILANNMANADTPGYKARDLDFRAVLSGVTELDSSLAVTRSRPRHLPASSGEFSGANLAYRVPSQPSLDGNTVDSELERAAFLDNSMRYQASLNFLGGRIKGLMLAIRGE